MVKFTWRVAVDGYEWLDDEKSGGTFLEPVSWRFRSYEPLEEFSGLFRNFAEIEPSRDGVMEFANRFGNLGGEVYDTGLMDEPPEAHSDCETDAEKEEWLRSVERDLRSSDSLGNFQASIREMRECINVWTAASGGAPTAQSMKEVQIKVNHHLDGNQVRVALEDNPTVGGLTLQVLPKSLLGALWVQFALAVGENKDYRKCGSCGLWFELSPETNRKSRYYCTEKCRSRAYRVRKDRARRMKAEGKTDQEIAKELDSDVETVAGWIRKKQND